VRRAQAARARVRDGDRLRPPALDAVLLGEKPYDRCVVELRGTARVEGGEPRRPVLVRLRDHGFVAALGDFARSSATSRSMSSTCQNAWLAAFVPAFGVG
jgi:hypothetical protein